MNNLPLPEELIEIIRDYAVGDKKYWKEEYYWIMQNYDDKCIVYDQDVSQMKFRSYVYVSRDALPRCRDDRYTPTPGYYKVNNDDFDFLKYWNKGICFVEIKYDHFAYEKREWRSYGLCRGSLDAQGLAWTEEFPPE
tara:strand:- start:175 stop:585 length:411 start_codon:yes stop_codon:yes gene_type:complete